MGGKWDCDIHFPNEDLDIRREIFFVFCRDGGAVVAVVAVVAVKWWFKVYVIVEVVKLGGYENGGVFRNFFLSLIVGLVCFWWWRCWWLWWLCWGWWQ